MEDLDDNRKIISIIWPRGYKTFLMLNSAKTFSIYLVYLVFMSRLNLCSAELSMKKF